MGPDRWDRLATVFLAGGAAVLLTLGIGVVLVPLLNRCQFVSRESKEGVAHGRTDSVPMGGGFILLLGVTAVIGLLRLLHDIRSGYAVCFLLAFWGFGLLGYLDDRSKALARGYSNQVKVLLQFTVTLAFAVSYYWYGRYYNNWDMDYLTLPFVGQVSLDLCHVPFVMLFLFWVSNAVNVTDGFNGLAGGTGAGVALAYTVVTFLIGAAALSAHNENEIAIRMFALSHMSAAVAGALVAYLYFNWSLGVVYFGDTGSMALGAALAFLAVFSRTEFLCCVIGGVFFTEAASVFIQKLTVYLSKKLVDPLAQRVGEPFRPFIIAPLHHHFEHLLLREMESTPGDERAKRTGVRQRITVGAWRFGLVFGAIGVFAEYGHYRGWPGVYDWSCAIGAIVWLAVLVWGSATRFLYDCYFSGPDLEDTGRLTYYRGVPWRCLRWRLYHVYEHSEIRLAELDLLERRTALFQLLFSRVDARIMFGLVEYQVAQRSPEPRRGAGLRRALSFWERVPVNRFLTAQRHEILGAMAVAYCHDARYTRAIDALETLYRDTQDAAVLVRIDAVQGEALTAAERAYAEWALDHRADEARREALAAHQELLDLLRVRYRQARHVRERLGERDEAPPEERLAVDRQIELLREALAVAADRCDRLQPVVVAA